MVAYETNGTRLNRHGPIHDADWSLGSLVRQGPLPTSSSRKAFGLSPRAPVQLDDSIESSNPRRELDHMFATIRRYEGVDKSRTDELVKKIDETLTPSLRELPGFSGYYVIDTGNGVLTSVSFFDTSAHADESTTVASGWVRDQKLETALPNAPKITSGEIVAHETRELVKA
jgi:hypothetical protein